MDTTRLSSKGQVIIPKPVRSAHHWEAGQELVVIDVGDGVLLRPRAAFRETTLDSVAGCLAYSGRAKTLGDMEAAIERGAKDRRNDLG